ncbi:MAG: prepilin-type N-terminal cleavage/methylation domain-containing protein [bacterium]
MNNKGFTLINLIIGMVIAAVIAAAAIPYISFYINYEHARAVVQTMKNIAEAENYYYLQNVEQISCSVNIGGTAYPVLESFHIYTNNFQDLINNGELEEVSDVNYFGQLYSLTPYYSNIVQNSNNFCVRNAGLLVSTYIPYNYKGVISQMPGAFAVGVSGNMEEIGYYITNKTGNTELDAALKYNW